ncbi:MAG: hypothetical protein FJZ78_05150 [Bacteroidetes bacterium]|nr:hypothetical protein [Bacteroidota bacterium]
MIKTFTQNDLIRFIYQETTEEESREIRKSVKVDRELSGQLDALQQMTRALDSEISMPGKDVVAAIMQHAKFGVDC